MRLRQAKKIVKQFFHGDFRIRTQKGRARLRRALRKSRRMQRNQGVPEHWIGPEQSIIDDLRELEERILASISLTERDIQEMTAFDLEIKRQYDLQMSQ